MCRGRDPPAPQVLISGKLFDSVLAQPVGVAGGEQLLNPAAFAGPAPCTLGNDVTHFRRPGFYSIDLSVTKFVRTALVGRRRDAWISGRRFQCFEAYQSKQSRCAIHEPGIGRGSGAGSGCVNLFAGHDQRSNAPSAQ